VVGNHVQLKFATRNAFQINPDEMFKVSNTHEIFKTSRVTFVKSISTIVVNDVDDGGIIQGINRGSSGYLFNKFRLNTDIGTVIWKGAKLTIDTPFPQVPTGLSYVAIYKDVDYNGAFNSDTDVMISYGTDRFDIDKITVDINLNF